MPGEFDQGTKAVRAVGARGRGHAAHGEGRPRVRRHETAGRCQKGAVVYLFLVPPDREGYTNSPETGTGPRGHATHHANNSDLLAHNGWNCGTSTTIGRGGIQERFSSPVVPSPSLPELNSLRDRSVQGFFLLSPHHLLLPADSRLGRL